MKTKALVALGSNLGDRKENIEGALRALEELGSVLSCSSLHETKPVGPAQPDYLNALALIETELTAQALLVSLLDIERKFGRVRRERWGARSLDLDLIAFGDEEIDEPNLRVPHPEAHRRAFVLVPLCEVASDWVFPQGRSARELLEALDQAQLAEVRIFESKKQTKAPEHD